MPSGHTFLNGYEIVKERTTQKNPVPVREPGFGSLIKFFLLTRCPPVYWILANPIYPLAGGAWRTAIAASALFAIILVFRVRAEEAALMRHPAYVRAMGRKRRFIPGRERD